VDEEILRHYEETDEAGRLSRGAGRLELLRTQELLRRHLPPAPARILDVGGGPGRYARWLADEGYDVRLIDPAPHHVDQARAVGVDAAVGDARQLEATDSSVDAVLLLGPLYHLVDRADRVVALTEARRAVRPAGAVFVAAVNRFASLVDGLVTGHLDDPTFAAVVAADLATGQHRNPGADPHWFTTAYFHHPDELLGEVRDAGLDAGAVYGIEGPGGPLVGGDVPLDDAALERLARAARAVETEPTMLGWSYHLLAVATRPSDNP
jgi:SAM-dependent methyltransferase